jgi:hypothetical protein
MRQPGSGRGGAQRRQAARHNCAMRQSSIAALLQARRRKRRRSGFRSGGTLSRRLALVAPIGLIAAASAHGSGSAAAAPKCASSSLVVWLNDEGAGTAGSFYYKIEFFNLSGHKCTLFGYPGVSAINLGGHQIGTPARREHFRSAKLLKLAPRSSAIAILHVTDPGVLPASSCHATFAAGLRVYPPGQTRAKIVPFPVPICSERGHSNMAVRAIEAI